MPTTHILPVRQRIISALYLRVLAESVSACTAQNSKQKLYAPMFGDVMMKLKESRSSD